MTWQSFPDLVDPALVTDAVIHACGERPVELIKRRQTRRRATYEVRFPHRVVFFKREVPIAYGFPELALEQWALVQAASMGLQVPEPLALDCSEAKFPFRWLLLSALPGLSLPDARLAPDAEAKVVRQTGALLYRLHQVRVEGFGPLQDDEYLRTGRVRGAADDWRCLIVGAGRDDAEYLARTGVLTPSEGARVTSFIEAGVPELDSGQLLHGDVQRAHIFVEPYGWVTGIIDFGGRESGDPEWEMSWVVLREDEEFIRALFEGYREVGGRLNEQTLNCYLAVRLLRMICRRVSIDGMPESDVSAMKDRLLGLLPA